MVHPFLLKNALSLGGSGPHVIHGSLGPPHPTEHPKLHSIGSDVFAGLMIMTDRQTTLLRL